MREWLVHILNSLSRREKKTVTMVMDACIAAVALWGTYSIPRLEILPQAIVDLWWLVPLSGLITVGVFYAFGLYHTVIRFAGSQFFLHAMFASVLVSWIVGIAALVQLYSQGKFPTAIFVIYPFYLMVGCVGARLVIRRLLDRTQQPGGEKIISVIYGAGSAGVQLYSAIRFGSAYTPIAFVDDDATTQGHRVHGLMVWSPNKLQSLIDNKGIKTVLLAIPSLEQRRRAEIIKHLQTARCQH